MDGASEVLTVVSFLRNQFNASAISFFGLGKIPIWVPPMVRKDATDMSSISPGVALFPRNQSNAPAIDLARFSSDVKFVPGTRLYAETTDGSSS